MLNELEIFFVIIFPFIVKCANGDGLFHLKHNWCTVALFECYGAKFLN